MKMTYCDVDDLEWNLETGTLKEYLSDPEMDYFFSTRKQL